jgi:hypothetical protein
MRYAWISRQFDQRDGMRALLLFTAILAAGCATQPTNQHTPLSTGPIVITDAGRLALAKNLNLKPVDKDGLRSSAGGAGKPFPP